MSQPLKGQKSVVTGANSGIGEGVARARAAAGADVKDATRVVTDLWAMGVLATALRAEVTQEAEVRAIFVGGGMTLYPELARGG